ncbi:MAG: family 43 glycosylhydrolase, partial [Chitinophagaceae bacterium]|nr:family 43 glycosylhydrolase [Chitinophagaceae bacterium]
MNFEIVKYRIVVSLSVFISVFSFSQRLVLPGDHPDPSVIKIGDTYWATSTTSNWAPVFPLMKSKNLITWELSGHIFNQIPEWADYYFWAPELQYENGKAYVYYAAHKKGGNLCVGIASADRPEGPYKDHGPVICQEVGSIDAFPVRDENGKLHLIWKEDANSVGKPTPIWIQELNEERTALVGEKHLMFKNDVPWEGNLVEGVSIKRNGDYFYAFYAGAGCCGRGCTYAVGVARSKKLLSAWEKYPNNPVLVANDEWKCPGHGTPIEKDGKYYFMFHAYNKKDDVYVGRQGLLMEYSYTPDGWIKFLPETNTSKPLIKNFRDDFKGHSISNSWQWSVFHKPNYSQKRGKLRLTALPATSGTFIAQSTLSSFYTTTAKVNLRKSGAAAGLGVIGDEDNMVTTLLDDKQIKVVQLKEGKETIINTVPSPKRRNIYLRMDVS